MMRFDAHCHVFNGGILGDATKLMAKPEKVRASWLSWIAETIQGIVSSEDRNQRFVCDALRRNFPGDVPATIPLAMDIHYLFSPSLQPGQLSGVENDPLFLNSGLERQLNALKSLSAKGNCFPFFPVDPRRPGVVRAVTSGKIVTRKRGGFYGVKLYPRLGYHPLSSNLVSLYAYCESNGIPITTHASPGGFPPFGTQCAEFSHPREFRSVLAQFPKLRIDLAHFGRGDRKWSDMVFELMNQYEGVYSDLACYNSPGDVQEFAHTYMSSIIVRKRVMYGSDFDVFYLTETKFDMQSYIESFKTWMGKNELEWMMGENPMRFLGI